jgi:hypothetical protein
MNGATGRTVLATSCVLGLLLANSCSRPQNLKEAARASHLKVMEVDEGSIVRAVDALDLDVLNRVASLPPVNFMADGVRRVSIRTSVGQKELMCDLHDPSIPGPSDTTHYIAIANKILASKNPGQYAQLAYACLLYLSLAEEPLAKEVMEKYRTTEVEEIKVRLQDAFFMKPRDPGQAVHRYRNCRAST